MGGLPVVADIAKFKNKNKVHIIVGSPGRLRHLVQDGYIDISTVRLLVLDEADKLVEKSFQADINYIFSALPKQKQVIMSSATYPPETKAIICQYMKNPQHVCPDSSSVLLGIEQKFTTVEYSSNVVIQTKHKYKELLKILSQRQFKQCLIFCNYQARIDKLHSMLTRDKWPSQQLYGQQEQLDRLDALRTLQEYKCRILIATDLAARGIDASNVDLVINFETPYDWQTYLHRIGRAGRYGSYGMAVTIMSEGADRCKFMKFVNPLKNSLKICNLWNDIELFSDDLNTPADIKLANGDNSNTCTPTIANQSANLWKEITTSNEDLNNSFNESTSINIESFSDLLKSFENSTHEQSQNISYVNIKIDKGSANVLYNSLEYKIKEQCYPQNPNSGFHSEDSSQKIIFRNGSNDTKDCEKKTTHSNVTSHEQIDNKIHVLDERALNTEDKTTSENIKVNVDDSDEDQSCINKEMALLGLPTAFASKRDSHLKKQTGIKKCQHIEVDYTDENSNLNKIKVESSISSSELNENGHLQENLEDVLHENGYVQKSSPKNKFSRIYSQRKCEDHQHRKLYTKKCAPIINDSDSSSSSDQETSGHAKINQSYINWYKQLKMRTKQLEFAFYIEEMSKV